MTRSNRADRALVAKARALKHCLATHRSRPRKCKADQTALQRTGAQLAAARRGLAQVAKRTAHASASAVQAGLATAAPALTASGEMLSWTKVANVNSYLLMRTVPGQPAQLSVQTAPPQRRRPSPASPPSTASAPPSKDRNGRPRSPSPTPQTPRPATPRPPR